MTDGFGQTDCTMELQGMVSTAFFCFGARLAMGRYGRNSLEEVVSK